MSLGRSFAYRTVKKVSSQRLSPHPVSKGAHVLPRPKTACWPLPDLIAARGRPIQTKATLQVTEPSSQGAPSGALRRTLLRLAAVLALVFLLHQLLNWASSEAELGAGKLQIWMLALFLLTYAVLIAVPFVPGVEVGLTLMVMEGPWIAPWIYAATVFGLTLAYAVGEVLPYPRLHRILADLRLRRACNLIDRLHPLGKAERLALLEQRAPGWAKPLLTRFRYVLMAILINLPGSTLIGGGGGLMFLAGFSRMFHTLPMIVTIMLAVAPVPLLFWAFGLNLSTWW